MLALASVPAPLVIGITGHRDLRDQDLGGLSSGIKHIFLELKEKYRFTPLILLSALADGADRLAADIALSREIQARLFVPLPMERAIYEQDFDRDSLTNFRALLEQAGGYLELPLVEGNTRESIMRKGHERDLQYESVGKYIVQKSQILIALWDGVESGLVGGTSSVVRFQKEGLPLTQPVSLDPLEGSPVYQIITPHDKNPNPGGNPFERVVSYPTSFRGNETKAEKYYSRMFLRINEFNRHATAPDSALCTEVKKSKRYLLKDLEEDQFSEELRADVNRYAVVDALTLRFQAEKVRTDRLLHGIVFLAFLLFVLFAHLSQHPLLLTASLSLVLLAGLWQRRFRRRDGDTKFEDYRAMAEGLRVRFFWRFVDLPNSIADHYLGKQRTELDWIRHGFRGWDVLSDFAKMSSPKDLPARINDVRRYWIVDQQEYFHRASERDEKRLRRLDIWQTTLVCFAVGLAAVVLAFVFRQSWPKLLHHEFFADFRYDWKDVPIILVEAALAAAALLHNYGNGMAYREHAKQYKRIENIFLQVSETLSAVTDPTTACQYIKKLGEEALRENGDWVLLHRERPLDVPHP
jgi:hypothetical protein